MSTPTIAERLETATAAAEAAVVTLEAGAAAAAASAAAAAASLTALLNHGRNRVVNGSMRIDQRNAGASVTTGFPVDKFRALGFGGGSGTFTAQRLAATPPLGFTNYVRVTVTGASTPSAGHAYYFHQYVEGNYLAGIPFGIAANGQSVTLSFRVRSSLTGTFSGVLSNGALGRTYVFTYVINAANTWETKSITIPVDTTGTWAFDHTAGAFLSWDLGAGSTYTNATTGWQAATILKSTGSVNLIATNGATWDITGVQLEPGTVASEFEHMAFPQLLRLCQREYSTSCPYGIKPAQGAGGYERLLANKAGAVVNKFTGIRFPVAMRVAPGLTLYNPAAANAHIRDITASNDCSAEASYVDEIKIYYLTATGHASTAIDNLLVFDWAADASL